MVNMASKHVVLFRNVKVKNGVQSPPTRFFPGATFVFAADYFSELLSERKNGCGLCSENRSSIPKRVPSS